jgi:hypothetical protein
MKRGVIFKSVIISLILSAAFVTGLSSKIQAESKISYDKTSGQVLICNGRLVLNVQTKDGLNANSLRDTQSGRVYADADYVWPGGKFPTLIGEPEIIQRENGNVSVIFRGRLDEIMIAQKFTAPAQEAGVLIEEVTISNPGKNLVDTSHFGCGFAKKHTPAADEAAQKAESHFSAIPFRKDTVTRRLCDYSMTDLFTLDVEQITFESSRGFPHTGSRNDSWGSEAWAWYENNNSLMIIKYNNEAMEWSLLKPLKQAELVLRFGGAGLWRVGDPEAAAALEPGETFSFGMTRLEIVDGGWRESYSAFRCYMEKQGNHPPKGFNPPVHWNELYDNQFFGNIAATVQDPNIWPYMAENLYRVEDMRVEAAKAAELGCELFYMDPGWETACASTVWDTERLGPVQDFIKMIQTDYGIQYIGLWTPLAEGPPSFIEPSKYTEDALRRDENVNIITYFYNWGPPKHQKIRPLLCSAAPAYLDVKVNHFLELAKNGVKFFLIDGTQFSGPCYDPAHGHRLPLTRHEHIMGYFKMIQEIKRQYPDVLIEIHDLMAGPCSFRYIPTYFLYTKPFSHDALWAFEYMWDPMANLMSGESIALYYLNLAYSIPFYLHINLKSDNENALVFWWNASTIRYLGVGGRHPDEKVWEAHKQAMKTYMRLKPFFTQGDFYGLDEMIHVHTLKEKNAAVINCFNLAETPETKTFTFTLSEAGLSSQSKYKVVGAGSWQQEGETIELTVALDGRDAAVIELVPASR